jgi:hypothetical protein
MGVKGTGLQQWENSYSHTTFHGSMALCGVIDSSVFDFKSEIYC